MKPASMRGSIVVRNIGELASPEGTKARCGPDMSALRIEKNAALVAEDGIFTYCGPEATPEFAAAATHTSYSAASGPTSSTGGPRAFPTWKYTTAAEA